ncbi:MAG: Gfo/Idh/MocA family oxidoreductase, partial [Armatimonadetes bacterium]|nr:Gfo/Idh/MocA family oxidoreductase [Armatimonadota bacterium]
MTPVKAGLIGCGAISGKYLENSKKFAAFDIVAVADLRREAAQARAAEYDIPLACTPDELLANPEVEVVINLTPHQAHGPVGIATLEAGKSPYVEKPLAVHRAEGQRMLELAAAKGLRVGAAPDTFFGGAWQTARKLIDDGAIGRPVAAMACLHAFKKPQAAPQPADGGYVSFYRTDFFEFGVTWGFDRAPYYLHALIHLLGPVQRVTGSAQQFWGQVEEFKDIVKTPTHFAGVLDFANGAVGTMVITSDVHATGLPHIEVYGTEGSLRCIDPNNFSGPILLRTAAGAELKPVDCPFGYNDNSRGVGIADLAVGLRHGRPHRADGAMGYHVIDIVHALHEASAEGRHVELQSTCAQPAPLPLGLTDWSERDRKSMDVQRELAPKLFALPGVMAFPIL